MLTIGNDELEKLPKLGKSIVCNMCGKRHRIEYGERVLPDGTREKSKSLAFFKCKGRYYLTGINGVDIRETLPHKQKVEAMKIIEVKRCAINECPWCISGDSHKGINYCGAFSDRKPEIKAYTDVFPNICPLPDKVER